MRRRVTDGEHVFAFFGSHGLYCLDMNGEVKWQKLFGEMLTKHGHGESASPVLYGDMLFVNWDRPAAAGWTRRSGGI